MIRGSDGLDYEDLNARLLGEPAKTMRNVNIQSYRANPRWTAVQVQGYIDGFDSVCPDGDPGPSQLFAAHHAGLQRSGRAYL